jgi:hypothetical protein
MTRAAVPEALRAQVLADWAPVRPLRSPWRRAAWLAPLAALTTGNAAIDWGPQRDWSAPGFAVTATLSAAQWAGGLWLLAVAFREAVPGRALERAATAAVLGIALLGLAINLAAKAAVAAALVPAGRDLAFWAICLRGSATLAAPVLVVSAVLVARAFPVRPAWAGALAGLGAGVLADSGWRLGCFVTEASHVVGAHWLAIAGCGALGAALASLADRVRWRRWRGYQSTPAGRQGAEDP